MWAIYSNDGQLYTGGSNGSLISWKGNSASKSVIAHKGIINAINFFNNTIFTGGSDNWIKLFSQSLSLIN